MGPLAGIRVLEIEGIGPCPFAGMLLADMGADVVVVRRPVPNEDGVRIPPKFDQHNRGKRIVELDLKTPAGVEAALQLASRAAILIEGFRPGVTERLGVGPQDCWRRNPALVYGRVTGWGQTGPLSQAAGHDLNYIALTGVLDAIGRAHGKPTPPLNIIGDYAGGALHLALGVVCALVEAGRSGVGQVVDAAMLDGVVGLSSIVHVLRQSGLWNGERGRNFLDSGAYYYDVYETSDGKHISIAAIEGRFHADLFRRIGWPDPTLPDQADAESWPAVKKRLSEIFLTRSREEWCSLLEGTDVCFAPVLSFDEAPLHEHNRARSLFVTAPDGVLQTAPAPRFSRTPSRPGASGPHRYEAAGAILRDWNSDRSSLAAASDTSQ